MNFQESLRKEDNMKQVIDKFYYKLGFIKSARQNWNNSIGRANQRDDIDTILTWKNGKLVTVSEKFRFTDYNDFLMEVESGNSIGSTFKSHAEKMVYTTPNNVYCLNMTDVKNLANFFYKQESVKQAINELKNAQINYNKSKFIKIKCVDCNNKPIYISASKVGSINNLGQTWFTYNIMISWDIIINNFQIHVNKFDW